MGFSNSMKNIDIFGHSISLTFKKQEKHKTIFGGMITFLIMIILLILLANQLTIMQNQGQNVIFQTTSIADYNSLGPVNLLNTNMLLYIYLYHRDNQTFDLPSLENTFSTLEVIGSGLNQQVYQKFRICQRQDFQNLNSTYLYDSRIQCDDANTCNGLFYCLNSNDVLDKVQQIDTKLHISTCRQSNPDCLDINLYQIAFSYLNFEVRVIQEEVNFEIQDRKPTVMTDRFLYGFSLNRLYETNIRVLTRYNTIQKYGISSPFQAPQVYSFFDIDIQNSRQSQFYAPQFIEPGSSTMFSLQNSLSSNQVNYYLRNYKFLEVISFMGGISIVIIFIVSFLIEPVARFYYISQIVQENYQLKQNLQKQNKKNNGKIDIQSYPKIQSPKKDQTKESKIVKIEQQIKESDQDLHIKKIEFSMQQQIQFFVMNQFQKCFCCCQFSNKNLFQIYQKGKQKYKNEIDISKLLKDLRILRAHKKLKGFDQKTEKIAQTKLLDFEISYSSESDNQSVQIDRKETEQIEKKSKITRLDTPTQNVEQEWQIHNDRLTRFDRIGRGSIDFDIGGTKQIEEKSENIEKQMNSFLPPISSYKRRPLQVFDEIDIVDLKSKETANNSIKKNELSEVDQLISEINVNEAAQNIFYQTHSQTPKILSSRNAFSPRENSIFKTNH